MFPFFGIMIRITFLYTYSQRNSHISVFYLINEVKGCKVAGGLFLPGKTAPTFKGNDQNT